MEELKYRKLMDLSNIEDTSEEFEFLLKISRPLKFKLPSWSGIMQMVQNGDYPGQSSVVLLPMLDLNPSDMPCVYSTLQFVAVHARNLNMTPIVRFDQPLYWKALCIVTYEPDNSEIKSVIVRLGGFHTEMSLLGCIGQLMENSGLEELLGTVYAPNTVGHMLSGKAIARAIRGHFLVDDALNAILVKEMIPIIEQTEGQENDNINQSDDSMSESVQSNKFKPVLMKQMRIMKIQP